MSWFYIDIHFSSSVNEGHSIDTQFCTYNLTLEGEQNNHSKYPKIIITFHALNHSSHIIKMILLIIRLSRVVIFQIIIFYGFNYPIKMDFNENTIQKNK